MSRKRGFTLLEILVVVGILGLLAAMLFPVFIRAREKGRQAVCLSNLKQIGAAMQMYIQDYERYPHALDAADRYASDIWKDQDMADVSSFATIPDLTDVMQPYVQSANIWRCPSDYGFDIPDSLDVQLKEEETKPSCFAKYGSSYFYRTELMFLSLSDDFVKDPVRTNVLFDADGSWHGGGVYGLFSEKRYGTLFADGHVKSLNREQMAAAWATPVQ